MDGNNTEWHFDFLQYALCPVCRLFLKYSGMPLSCTSASYVFAYRRLLCCNVRL